MTKEKFLAQCLCLPDAVRDTPFRDENWTAARHRQGGKIFALVYERGGKLFVNLKCEPMKAEFWRASLPGVSPGYHMNKVHWNTVDLASPPPPAALAEMLHDSYALTKAKQRPAPKRPAK